MVATSDFHITRFLVAGAALALAMFVGFNLSVRTDGSLKYGSSSEEKVDVLSARARHGAAQKRLAYHSSPQNGEVYAKSNQFSETSFVTLSSPPTGDDGAFTVSASAQGIDTKAICEGKNADVGVGSTCVCLPDYFCFGFGCTGHDTFELDCDDCTCIKDVLRTVKDASLLSTDVEVYAKSNQFSKTSFVTLSSPPIGDDGAFTLSASAQGNATNGQTKEGEPCQRHADCAPVKISRRQRACTGCGKKTVLVTYQAYCMSCDRCKSAWRGWSRKEQKAQPLKDLCWGCKFTGPQEGTCQSATGCLKDRDSIDDKCPCSSESKCRVSPT